MLLSVDFKSDCCAGSATFEETSVVFMSRLLSLLLSGETSQYFAVIAANTMAAATPAKANARAGDRRAGRAAMSRSASSAIRSELHVARDSGGSSERHDLTTDMAARYSST